MLVNARWMKRVNNESTMMCRAYQYGTQRTLSHFVMAGLVPAIHVLLHAHKNVDARDKPGHDAVFDDDACER
jgi:hypothetical protein